MTSTTSSAAAAAKQILGFYDTIPAMDQRAFTAGLVEMLSTYPPSVLDRAANPARGLPAFVTYPNLAKFKEHLDQWNTLFWEEQAKLRAAYLAKQKPVVQRSLPGAIIDPPPGHFANVHIPDSHPRYSRLSEWAKTAELKLWKFGRSSEGRAGIWIPLNVWQEGTPRSAVGSAAMKATENIIAESNAEKCEQLTDRDCC